MSHGAFEIVVERSSRFVIYIMLEIVVLFLLSSVSFFIAQLEKPTTFWGFIDAAYPIVMGILSAGIVYKNK
ncbi:uncharacterized protein LOC110185646 [Drosophila serrata]|uniref:uncharacterized protein LOC110185646 n=1 Tax=Drosophila serrata TaxID=7274 RepID=UPI000A1D125E|nr:uncharacterized protein LOC110185646 [Drosophila serrata]